MNGIPLLLIKPAVNYNSNGASIGKAKDFYNLANKDILVIHDELALPFGTVRVRLRGSDAGNNGIKGVNASIGEGYARIRVGIGSEDKKQGDIDYVLSNFTREETKVLPEIFILTETIIHNFLNESLEPSSYIV